MSTIALSLISHTNTGKTTLARTLLGRDVGSVRDAQHVTQEATCYPLLSTVAGDALVLWDTPGFGDSARLARRLGQQSNPVGWFLSQVWDRFQDRAFFLAQQVVRNVRDQADVVLYLVNAAEAPGDAGYLAPELDILEWIGKPGRAIRSRRRRRAGAVPSVRARSCVLWRLSMRSRAAGYRRSRCSTSSAMCCRTRVGSPCAASPNSGGRGD